MASIDLKALRAYSLQVWRYKMGESVSLMIHVGDRLGLYEALSEAGPLSPAGLAERTGLSERLVQEWLLGQAAAELLERNDDGTFEMSAEASMVLADASQLTFAAGAFGGGETRQNIEAILEAFRTGRGFTYGDMGPATASQIDRVNRTWLQEYLPAVVLPILEGVVERLEAGADVADVGCGGGMAIEALARQYPQSRFVGYEPSTHAVAAARRRLDRLPNVTLREALGEDLPTDPTFDLIMTLDCMHDLPHPDRVAAAVKRALRSDGTWLIKDTKCGPTYEDNLRNPLLAMMYAFSVSSCLPSALSTEGSMGLGTLGFSPPVAQEIAGAAGFTSFQVHDLDTDPVHFYYEVRH